MSMDETLARFEELDAGRVLGDLTSEETSEWQILVTDMEDVHSIELELLATELELKHVQPCDLSSSLSNKIADTIPTFSNKNINQPATQIISILPWLGWAAAACLLVFFNLPTGDGIQNISAELTQAKTELSDKEKTIIELESAKQELAKLNENLSSELSNRVRKN